MPIVTDGPMMLPNMGIDQAHTGLGEQLAASAAEAWSDSPASQLASAFNIADAKNDRPREPMAFDPMGAATGFSSGPDLTEEVKPAVPRMDMIEALDRVKKAGLEKHLTLPNQPDIPPAQLEIMMRTAQARREREATIERGPQGFIPSALQVGTSFLVGAADPINVASAFIPVMGELRYGKLLASAGDSVGGRLAIRAGVGAAQGAVGQAALEPLDWWAHTQEGRDFGMSDVLHNIMFGAALGGGLHAGGGFISDAYRGAKGRPLYPFGPGEPLARVPGAHVPGIALGEEGVTPAQLEAHFRREEPPHALPEQEGLAASPENDALVAQIERNLGVGASVSREVATINDLPPRAHEDAMRVAISDLINGDAVRSGDVLAAAAQTDLRIAESFEAWHGSPHDFERFDLARIGSGEGAQAFGHGLYFAEKESVARSYRDNVDRDIGYTDAADEALYWLNQADRDKARAERLYRENASKNGETPSTEVLEHFRPGNLYRVRIAGNREHFLDWDKPLGEQSEFVQQAVKKIYDRHGWEYESDGVSVEDWHREFQVAAREGGQDTGQEDLSALLREAGIPGIKYFDQGSRGAGQFRVREEGGKFFVESDSLRTEAGPFDTRAEARAAASAKEDAGRTRNFVVFNDKDIEITHKNGEPVKREEFLAEREAERAQHVARKQPRGRAAADPQTWSLFEFLAHEGGLRPDPELNAIFGSTKSPFVPGFGALVRPNGRTLDDALRLAKDHGYMFDAADVTGGEGKIAINDLLDRLAEERAGRRQYRSDQQFATKAQVSADLELEKHDILRALHDEIEATTGQKGVQVDRALEGRVVQIIQREGEKDVLAAYERAIMEDAERYEGLANERSKHAETAHIPGWDAPESGAASRAGEPGAIERRQAGLPGEGAGGADGGQPRAAGAGDRAPAQAQLDRAAAWRGISRVTPDFDAPDIVAASNAAAKVEPPKTKLDDRVTAAEKAEAYAKALYDMLAHRLPDDERVRLEETIASLEQMKADRDVVTQRGAACLFEGSQ